MQSLGKVFVENQHCSPSRQAKISHKADILSQVTNTTRNSTLFIHTSNPESPIKHKSLATVEECKRLKVTLADTLFELKKIQEDFSQYRRTTKLQREKQTKKWQEAYAKLKSNSQDNNEDFKYKYTQIITRYEGELQAQKIKAQAALKQQLDKLTLHYQEKLSAENKCHKRQLDQTQNKYQTQIASIIEDNVTKLTELQHKHKQQVKDILIKKKIALQQKQKQFDSIFVALQSEKKIEQKLHEKTKTQFQQQKDKLNRQLCYESNMRTQAEQQVISKDKQIRHLKNLIAGHQTTAIVLQQRNTKKLTQLETQFLADKKALKKQYQVSLQQLMQTHNDELTKFTNKIQQLEQIHTTKQQLTLKSIQQLSSSFKQRPSKREDTLRIEILEQQVVKKDEEIRKLLRQVKHYTLELQNKEDIYTRIFRGSAASRQEKKSAQKDFEEKIIEQRFAKENIFRKSHTADIKFLLKMCTPLK